MSISRRQFLQGATAIAAMAGGGQWLFASYPLRYQANPQLALSAQHQQILLALIPVFVQGQFSDQDDLAMLRILNNVDVAISGLAAHSRAELHQLLDLLQSRGGWLLLSAGSSQLSELSTQQKIVLLRTWQMHYLQLLRQTYQGLHELIMAACYGDPEVWPLLAYQLPAQVKGLFHD
ncbi:twin-arginine translocation signal domain-containing protein [Agarivorans sp. QJM3NY_29]|uniref:twin-arginine translocation signal domain-containing protein n=1 Tax=unclassified Agarivorans TaxID=2636026 RepID=UPI003D7EB959